MSELFGLFLLLLMVLLMLGIFQMQDHKLRRLELEERQKLLTKYLDVLEDNKRLKEELAESRLELDQYMEEKMRKFADYPNPSRNENTNRETTEEDCQ